MSNFIVGQIVYDLVYGKGTVVSVNNDGCKHPVGVKFDSNGDTEYYTVDGRLSDLCNRTLYFREIEIPYEASIPKRWRAEVEDGYFYINTSGGYAVIASSTEIDHEVDDSRYNSGNYFKRHEDLILLANKINEMIIMHNQETNK